MTHTIMSWASWVFAPAKNWLLPVWMPVYGHCVASNTALQSSPPPCLPSSPATTPSSSLKRENQPKLQLTISVVSPSHPQCLGQYPEHYPVHINVDSPPSSPPYATSSSSIISSRSSSLATTRSSSREKEQQLTIWAVNATSSPSKFSSSSSSLTATSSSSSETDHQPSWQPTIGVVSPPHHHCPGKVDPSSLQSISDGNSASSSSSSSNETVTDAATTTPLQQPDSTNQSYKYPPPFGQILGASGLGKTLLGADLSALLTMITLVNNDESIGLWGGVVCLLLLLGFLALLSAVLLKGIYPVIAMVTVLIGIGCSVAAICAYPLSGFLPHFWVTVLSSIVAFSITTPIMIIFCWKKCEREES